MGQQLTSLSAMFYFSSAMHLNHAVCAFSVFSPTIFSHLPLGLNTRLTYSAKLLERPKRQALRRVVGVPQPAHQRDGGNIRPGKEIWLLN